MEGSPPGDGAYARHGRLHVCGTKLCDEHGAVVQLRGMSTHGVQWYSGCVNDASLTALATDWHADVVRIASGTEELDFPAYVTITGTVAPVVTSPGTCTLTCVGLTAYT